MEFMELFLFSSNAVLLLSVTAFELNKNNSMNSILAFIAVSFLAFADNSFTRFYLDKSSTIKPK